MSAILRVHRGPAKPERILIVDGKEVGTLSEETNDFTISAGTHIVTLKVGVYHSVATRIKVTEGEVLEMTVEVNPDALAPILEGGFLRFHED